MSLALASSLDTRVYLDGNATMPIRAQVLDVLTQTFRTFGHASSVHHHGRLSRKHLESSRDILARCLDAFPQYVIITSGGTEANNLVIQGLRPHVFKILVGATEHLSVLNPDKEAIHLPVDQNGQVRRDILEDYLRQFPAPCLVSVMLVNNETGVIQDIQSLAELVHRYGGYIHTDAVQALGKIPVSFRGLGVDAMTLSAHKIGGPVGVGALLISENLPLIPVIKGGAQEKGRRAGTLAVPLVVAFAKALEIVSKDRCEDFDLLKKMQEHCPDAVIVGEGSPRVPQTLCVAMPGVPFATQLMAFDLNGISISAGAACSSGKMETSHVLRAMGLSEDVTRCAIRISTTWQTTPREIETFTAVWNHIFQHRGTL